MTRKKLTRNFFNRPALAVARGLLGKFLVRKAGKKKTVGLITEVEAYCGPRDLACHASKGRTKRTEIMFGPPGHAYVYLIYGLYHCLNVVTGKSGYPAAVLIRSAGAVNGPGKLCKFFKIDRSLNGEDITASQKLWFEDRGIRPGQNLIKKSKRVGVEYAKEYKDKLWRFYTEKTGINPDK